MINSTVSGASEGIDRKLSCFVFFGNLGLSGNRRTELRGQRATLRWEAGEATDRPGKRCRVPLSETPSDESVTDSASV